MTVFTDFDDVEYANHTAYITGQSLKVNGGDRCRE